MTSVLFLGSGVVRYEPKPTWQRAGGAGLVALGGAFFAAGVLVTRRRNVRLVDFRSGGKQVYVETASGRAVLVDKADCVITPNKSERPFYFHRIVRGLWWRSDCSSLELGDDFMDLLMKGTQGRYPIRLKGAKVDGISGDNFDIRKRLHEKWYGSRSYR